MYDNTKTAQDETDLKQENQIRDQHPNNKPSHQDESSTQNSPEPTHQAQRPLNARSQPSSFSVTSTDDDEYHDDRLLIDDGIPSNVPLEALAGPALILPSNDIDGHTLNEEFDWTGKEDDDDEETDKKDDEQSRKKRGALAQSSVIICLSKNSSHIAWTCILLFGCILIAIDVAIFVAYRDRVSGTSYGLQLWFTWLCFMWWIGFMSQIFVELVPWAIKKGVGYFRPQSTEVLRMRLSYYMALRVYIKLFAISAWAWGSWAFIKAHIALPLVSSTPEEGDKKAYGERIKENDKALRILDRLKKMKRKNPQEFLMKRIRRKNKNASGTNTNTPNTPRASHSMDENGPNDHYFSAYHGQQQQQQSKSIIANQQQYQDGKSNVKFPAQNMDTLIAIPPLEDRGNDEKQEFTVENQEEASTPDVINKSLPGYDDIPAANSTNKTKRGFINKFSHKMRKGSRNNPSQSQTPSGDEGNMSSPAPAALSRESTWFSRNSQDEKGFFGATRDFGLSTTAIPGKILKGGYNKFVSQNNNNKINHQAATNSTQQAKYLAKKIYTNLVGPDSNRDTIVEADLYPFFRTTKEATFAFGLFDTDGNGDISKRELRSGCIRIYRERKNLTRSMRDLSQATGKLDIILMIIFVIIWAIIVCAAFGVDVGTDLMPLWSAFVAASFVFGTSAKDAFEAIIFVFVTHPFDSGDRVFIQGENWVVHNRMHPLVSNVYCSFNSKWDGSIVYAKNSVLTTQYIINVRRSGRTGETVELQISFATPSWKIRKITDHMIEWCNKFPKLYTTNSASTNITSFQNQNMVNLSFYFEHTQNWQDAGGRWLRHNNFMMELKEECERLEITYSLPPQPYVEGNRQNDASPETYNMGEKAGYGLDGMQRRRPWNHDDEDGFKNSPIGGESNSHSGNSGADNSGAIAGAASAMMFAEGL
ncbi:hypothetical protein [Parasitella parasitica]|uniref:EF-hand domain-containing protein n=1 Tax=Parasitella parasitica TaxID=35722 RepID=A0A0B7MZW1_9FUNG|nr:hypothetical protein [Parasitella parasitica]